MKNNSREQALKLLNQIEKDKQFSHITIQRMLMKESISDIDRRFITHLVNGVLENKMLLDYWIRKLSTVRFGKLDPQLINILRLGLYQLAFMDKVPESAAVNESVNMAKKVRMDFGKFVNAILRAFVRANKWIEPPSFKSHPVTHLSIKYSHPEWLVQKWVDLYGVEFTLELLKSNNIVPPLSVRINTTLISREQWLSQVKDDSVKVKPSDIALDGVVLDSIGNAGIESLPGFKEGHFQVQDISSMCVAQVLDIKPDMLVIDVCAAPGGKATHVAQRLENTGKVLARDNQSSKLKVIQENIERLQLKNVEVELFDALELDANLVEKADIVLVDAPCSGLGIIRRKPDIKYNKTPEDLVGLAEIQYRILVQASKYVKSLGQLVYSTCTLNPDENDAIVDRFLNENKSFKREVIQGLPNVSDNGSVTFYPNVNNTDGFFIAKIIKIN